MLLESHTFMLIDSFRQPIVFYCLEIQWVLILFNSIIVLLEWKIWKFLGTLILHSFVNRIFIIVGRCIEPLT